MEFDIRDNVLIKLSFIDEKNQNDKKGTVKLHL